ncbi:MAG: rod shape-determining protein MreC, partial [Sphingobacteriales bacterium]
IPASGVIADTLPLAKVLYKPAKVINNSVRRVNNFLTLNVGRDDGIKPGMGVITKQGVVGRVKAVSDNYATVTSLLHSQWVVSAKLKKDNTLGSIKWDGKNYRQVLLDFIPLHVKVQKGDTVITSGFTGVFPEGVVVGRVAEVLTENDKNFFTIRVELAVDLSRLSYVYVLNNMLYREQDSLEVATTGKDIKE